MTDDADRTPRLVRVLLIVAGIGLIGVVVMLFVKDSLPLGWSLLLFTMCMVLMLGGAYATAYVPDGPRNAYTQSGSGEESIPEFLPDEGGSARVRRAVVTSAFWLAFVVWVPCYAVPIAVLLRLFLADPDGDVDEAPFVISMVVGTIALAMYVVLGIFLSKWTVEGAHLRALRSALPRAVVRPNKTTTNLSRMVANTAPGVRVRVGGFLFSYVVVFDGAVSVWSAHKGRLIRVVDVSLGTITGVKLASVDVRFSALPGILVSTTALSSPLEICPVEHLIDFRSSAERFRMYLPQGATDENTTIGGDTAGEG